MKSPLEGKIVLVVDDEADIREIIIFLFQQKGCRVLEAASGKEGIKIVKAQPVDVVISDLRMPEGSGLDLLEEVRKINPDIPVVFLLSGYTDITEEQAKKKGARRLLPKPFDQDVLIETIESAFR